LNSRQDKNLTVDNDDDDVGMEQEGNYLSGAAHVGYAIEYSDPYGQSGAHNNAFYFPGEHFERHDEVIDVFIIIIISFKVVVIII
jgi:hypothetical protein